MPSYNFPGVTGWVALPEEQSRLPGTRARRAPLVRQPLPARIPRPLDVVVARGAGPREPRGQSTRRPHAAAGHPQPLRRLRPRGIPQDVAVSAARPPPAGGTSAGGAAGAAGGRQQAQRQDEEGQGAGSLAQTPVDPRQGDHDTSVRWFDLSTNTRQQ